MKRLALCIPLLLIASIALSATRIGSWTVIQSSADPMIQAITVPADAELMVLAVCLFDTGAPAPTAVTLDSDSLALETRVTNDTGEQTGIWTIEDDEGLAAGAGQNLVFNHAGAIDEGAHFFYAFFQDVDTAGSAVTSMGSTSSGSNNSTINTPDTVAAQTGDIAVGIGCMFGTDGLTLNDEVLDDTVFNNNDGAVGEISGSGANVTFTVTTGDFPAVSGIIVENAAAGGGGLLLRRRRAANDDTFEHPLKVAAGF